MKSYTDQVAINFCTNFEKAINEINDTFVTLYHTFDDIINGGTYSFPEEQTTRWNTLLLTAGNKALELITKIEEKYNEMKSNAQKYDDIVNAINSERGNVKKYTESGGTDTVYEFQDKIVMGKPFADGSGYPGAVWETYKTKVTTNEDGSKTRTDLGRVNEGVTICHTMEEALTFLGQFGNG